MVRVRNRHLLFEVQFMNQDSMLASRLVENLELVNDLKAKEAIAKEAASTLMGEANTSDNHSRKENPTHSFRPQNDHMDEKTITNLMWNSIFQNFGEEGASKVVRSLEVKYFNPDTHLGLLRTNRAYFQMVWAAMTLISKYKNEGIAFRVIHVGGTIKSCQLEAKAYNRRVLMNLAKKVHQEKLIKGDFKHEEIVDRVKEAYDVIALPNSFRDD